MFADMVEADERVLSVAEEDVEDRRKWIGLLRRGVRLKTSPKKESKKRLMLSINNFHQ